MRKIIQNNRWKLFPASIISIFLGGTIEQINAQTQKDSAKSSLDSVIVTAYGIKRNANSLGFATQTVSGDNLRTVPGSNFINSLSGRIAGVQITSSNAIGGNNNVIIRGFKSLTQSNQALFVVDGIPFDNTNQSSNGTELGNVASDWNTSDIASVTVLKGAAAAALYGSRAANGVVLINTRKATSGRVSFHLNFNQGIKTGFIDHSTMPKLQKEYGQGNGSEGYSAAYPNQNGYFYYTPVFNSGGSPKNVVITDEDLGWGPAYDKNLLVYNWDAFVPGNKNYGVATPWVASNSDFYDYFQTPLTNITSIVLDGSDESSDYKFGYQYTNDKGIQPNSNQRKHAVNFAYNKQIIPQLEIGATINYFNQNSTNRGTYDYRSANTNLRDFRQWLPSSVNFDELRSDYNRGLNASWNMVSGYYDSIMSTPITAAYHNNPFWNDYENYNDDSRERYFGNIHAKFNINNDLNLLVRFARDQYTQLSENRMAVGSYRTALYARNDIKYGENNFDVLLNYSKRLNHLLYLKVLLGSNIRRTNNQSISASTSGGLSVPGLYSIANSLLTPDPPVEYDGTKQINGYFGDVSLNIGNLVNVEGTIRRDKSSALPSNHNTYYYPSVSANFLFYKLLPQWDWLSYGKLRLNYAEVGNDAPIYSVTNTYVNQPAFNGISYYSIPSVNNNPNLKPERSKNYEFGLELGFLNNRINLDATYYHSKLYDQITPITPSTSTGYSQFYVNGGSIQNKGIEVSLNVIPVQTTHFTYDFTLNWSKNDNKVLSLYGGQSSYTIATYQNSIQLVAEAGKSYGILRGSDYQYLNGERLVDANGYYLKSSNKLSDLGKVTPDWIGGWSNRFRYNNFILSFLIDASKGGSVYSLDMDNGQRSGILAETAAKNDLGNPLRNSLADGGGIILNGVTADGQPNTTRIEVSDAYKLGSNIPFGSTRGLTAKSYVYDASWVKLREVSIGYDLPQKLLSKTKSIKNINLSLSGRNLWIIHKNLPYSDPEQGSPSTTLTNTAAMVYNQNASIGYQNGVYPTVREFAFNIRLTL